MSLLVRISMVVIILVVLAFNISYLLLASGDYNDCITFLTGDGTTDTTDARETCNDFEWMKEKRSFTLGISGAIIAACVVVFFAKRD